MSTDKRLLSDRFARASCYHPEWVLAGAGSAANALWLTEWLSEALDLRSGMRVLDLGCGRALSSVFLRREFGVQVWAADLWFSPSENLQLIRDAGVEDGVFPLHADARSLPFATEFFDAIVSVDSYLYYGTDDMYAQRRVAVLGGLAAPDRPRQHDGDRGAGGRRRPDSRLRSRRGSPPGRRAAVRPRRFNSCGIHEEATIAQRRTMMATPK